MMKSPLTLFGFFFLLAAFSAAPSQAQQEAPRMPIVFEGKVCFVDEVSRGLQLGRPQTGALETLAAEEGNSKLLRVQGTFLPGPDTWKEEERVRVPWPEIPVKDGERDSKTYSFVNYVPRELNARFQKPSPDDREAPVNRLDIDSIFIVPADWNGGFFSFSDKLLEIPALSPPNSITREEPKLAITKSELVDEVTLRSSYLEVYEPKRTTVPQTIRPIDGGKFLAIYMAEMKNSSVRLTDVFLETPSGAKRRCHLCAHANSEGTLYHDDIHPRLTLSPGRRGTPPVLYFAVPAATTKFTLHAGEQEVSGEVSP